jgi:hypothetical protein
MGAGCKGPVIAVEILDHLGGFKRQPTDVARARAAKTGCLVQLPRQTNAAVRAHHAEYERRLHSLLEALPKDVAKQLIHFLVSQERPRGFGLRSADKIHRLPAMARGRCGSPILHEIHPSFVR